MKKQLLLFISMLLPLVAMADDSGSCGTNVTYTYVSSTGTLTIQGSGAMTDYSDSGDVPWDSYRKDIKTVVIKDGVTSIGRDAFLGCSGLTSIEIPNSVTSIGNLAFHSCSSLTSIEIPNSVTSIGGAAFQYCSGLTSIEISNSVTSIGGGAFSFCSGLTSIEIPNSVTSIGDNAFEYCSRLTSVTIGNSVTSIGDYAFEYCSRLTSIEIPNSVTSIGDYAFHNTAWYNNQPNGLIYAGKVVYKYKGTMPDNTNITIKEGTLGIAGEAFYGCSGLTSIEIPNSVTSIGDDAFYGCSGLASVTVELESPLTIGYSTFSNRANATLYVPYGSKAAYEAANYWKEFKEIKEMPDRCATPTIIYKNGELTFDCETEGVKYVSTITAPESTEADGKKIDLSKSFRVSVYATKEGYTDSDIATQDIDIRGLKGDVNDDGDVTAQDASLILQKVAGKINW